MKIPVLMELVGGKGSLKRKIGEYSVLSETQIPLERIPPHHMVRRESMILVSIGKTLQPLEGYACPMGVLGRGYLSELRLKEKETVTIDM